MISYIPSLEFVRHLCGTYADTERQSELKVWPCGYGVALEVRRQEKSQLVAVVGADKHEVECFALFGLPNAIRLVGELTGKSSIQFTGANYPFGLTLTVEASTLSLQVFFEGKAKAAYVFAKRGEPSAEVVIE